VALLLYGYCQGERSSRVIEQRCLRDVAYRVIADGLHPDHATIVRFRARHETALGGLFSLDGTKVAGSAAQKANRTLPQIEKILVEAAGKRRGHRPGDEPRANRAGTEPRGQHHRPGRAGDAQPERLRGRIQRPGHGHRRPGHRRRDAISAPGRLTTMSRRGFAACESEWLLACAAHNLRKLHRHRTAG